MGVWFVNNKYDYRSYDDMKSCYQLINQYNIWKENTIRTNVSPKESV